MKTARLVISIMATVLGSIVFFQSCAVSALEEVEGMGATDGGVGVIMALILLAAGIIGICTHKKSRWLSLAIGFTYGFIGRIGIENAENFPDLNVWGGISFVFAAAYIIMFIIEVSVPKDTAPPSEDANTKNNDS